MYLDILFALYSLFCDFLHLQVTMQSNNETSKIIIGDTVKVIFMYFLIIFNSNLIIAQTVGFWQLSKKKKKMSIALAWILHADSSKCAILRKDSFEIFSHVYF